MFQTVNITILLKLSETNHFPHLGFSKHDQELPSFFWVVNSKHIEIVKYLGLEHVIVFWKVLTSTHR